MHMTFTPAALARLAPMLETSGKQLKLLHDTEGCGCVMSGVPALQLIPGPGPDDRAGESETLPFLFEPRHAIFFEPRLTVDYTADSDRFTLKSTQQIYTNRLQIYTGEACPL
ncbi:iron-sulfur cluster biosynthesis family protein [Paenibacillus sp. IB182496]|uniref:Iron-sulfur cluster biosynthesis family protein n=1 Tax=Paenibacillus sabuli TaxID=2772509 RepID=A0A927BXN0_9BACL|nr:iron-sulfur cluster biosynthesis family protein [Paenibacillus sabuli]MBD2847625.1 iron-sulfur cluster biosynthesis family protein [Paenibacillus sabuli]